MHDQACITILYGLYCQSQWNLMDVAQYETLYTIHFFMITQVVVNENTAKTCHADELRNAAAEKTSAVSDYILFFDDDDIARPDMISRMIAAVNGYNPASVGNFIVPKSRKFQD